MAKTIRIGFIGAGGIAHSHAKNLKRIEGVELVCAADLNEKGLEKFVADQGALRTYTDYKEMLKKEKNNIDAICVCTPNSLHAENSIAALKAGMHVIVEKPMAMNNRECSQMIAAAKKAKKQLVVGFQWRFHPKAVLLKKQADEGVFGKILFVRVQALRRRGIPNWGVFGRKDLQGGGPMIDIGVHACEMAHYVMGCPKPVTASGNTWTYLGDKPMKAVTSWQNWDHKSYTVEDLAVGMVRFDNGAMMSIEASFAAHIEKDVFTFQIMGEKGGATFDPLMIYKDENGYMWNNAPGFIPENENFFHKMRHFIEVCRSERENVSNGEQGRMIQQILDGVYTSAEKGREITIKEIS